MSSNVNATAADAEHPLREVIAMIDAAWRLEPFARLKDGPLPRKDGRRR